MADRETGRYKAFLLVGLMYFVIAVVAPALMLLMKGGSLAFWSYPQKGTVWACVAGVLGAIGAFGVLLAFGAGGRPAVVMSIVFAGAPIINAIVSIAMQKSGGEEVTIKPMFYVGILLAALGGCLVTFFKPEGHKPPPSKPTAAVEQTVQD